MRKFKKKFKNLAKRCYCEELDCPENSVNDTCELRPGGQCFSSYEEYLNDDSKVIDIERKYGCLPPEESALLQCKGNLVPHSIRKEIKCCNDADFCNKPPIKITTKATPIYNLEFPSETPVNTIVPENIAPLTLFLLITALSATILLLSLWICLKCRRRKLVRKQRFLTTENDAKTTTFDANHFNCFLSGCNSFKDLIDQSTSIYGSEQCVQRTIARQIELSRRVGTGRFGESWLANFLGQKVGVKIFHSYEDAAWLREMEIYQTPLLRHENILSYIAADIKSTKDWSQMLLITEYHENGPLCDYLQRNLLDKETLIKMAYSITDGLSHLHSEIFGSERKPAVAHRDLNSKCILVKSDKTCCISDFTLAARYCSDKNEIDISNTHVMGTIRYMAPEMLKNTMKSNGLEPYKMADVYSLGLVLWEMAKRCVIGDNKIIVTDKYEMPYSDFVSEDPTVQEMTAVVYDKQLRPGILACWEFDRIMDIFAKLMQECWHHDPISRLTALRVKKSISKLVSQLVDVDKNIV